LPHDDPIIERPAASPPTARQWLTDLGPTEAVNALIAFIFAATGPVAIILSSAARGGLGQTEVAAWIFGAFFVNGLVTLFLTWRWHMPLICFWTIPGTVLVGQALEHATHAEVLGAFVVTGILLAMLGLSGWMRRLQSAIPMPIVMGMVAGVFLRFGTDLVRAVHLDPVMAGSMVAAFIGLSAHPRWSIRMPPMIGALLVGLLVITVTGRMTWPNAEALAFTAPTVFAPAFSPAILLELVVPLAITVLFVQNGQGFAVLKAAGHEPPVNAVTLACGLASVCTAFLGTVSSCLTGPTNAIVTSGADRSRHYVGAWLVGLLALGFGLFASAFSALMLAAPKAFIAALAGLAMIRTLQAAFTTAFGGGFPLGALVAFLITVADQPIFNIGAPFWGLIAGWGVARLLEQTS
jgi:benzoate membrane transport protein